MLAKKILNECFGVYEAYIVDNKLSQYNPDIKNLDYFRNINVSSFVVLLTAANPEIYGEIRLQVRNVFKNNEIIDPFAFLEEVKPKYPTCGKYSYGPLCTNTLVESIGSFSCFAYGSTAVVNHPVKALSIHDFLYNDNPNGGVWYFSGVKHRPEIRKIKKSHIGNDVWLGRNVIITNGADIGNGVIAAAGAVITKDVPDYAVVAGVPARIIRYRYTPQQIEALNKIAWWDWEDDKIREYYDDFFEDVDMFIKKHRNDNI